MDEAEDLQRRLDNLSDEELERVFAKMRVAVGEKVFADLKGKEDVRMPRAQPKDDGIRQKYGRELQAIEDELENIYKNPLNLWEVMMENPDDVLGEANKNTDDLIDKENQ